LLTGLPLEVLGSSDAGGRPSRVRSALARIDRSGRAVWPSLFAYQYVAVLRRDPAFASVDAPLETPASSAATGTRTPDREAAS